MKGKYDDGKWKKYTSFLERLHFQKPKYDVNLDHNKENLYGVQNILQRYIWQIKP